MTAFFAFGIVSVLSILSYGGSTGGLYQQACGDAQGLLGGLYSMAWALGRPVGAMFGGMLLNSNAVVFCVTPVACVTVSLACLSLQRNRLQQAESEALCARSITKAADCVEQHQCAEPTTMPLSDDTVTITITI